MAHEATIYTEVEIFFYFGKPNVTQEDGKNRQEKVRARGRGGSRSVTGFGNRILFGTRVGHRVTIYIYIIYGLYFARKKPIIIITYLNFSCCDVLNPNMWSFWCVYQFWCDVCLLVQLDGCVIIFVQW